MAVEFATKGLEKTHAIGRDFDRANSSRQKLVGKPLSAFRDADCRALTSNQIEATRLKQFCSLAPETIGLVRGGSTPVALVRITGPSFFAKPRGEWDWYRYRYPVQILGWYESDKERWPEIKFKAPTQGTFQLLTGNSKTRSAIEKWLRNLGVPKTERSDSADDSLPPEGFPEGQEYWTLHKGKERSAKLARLAKDRALKKYRRLACEVCGFDFSQRYGKAVGHGYIECHHTLPVKDLKPNQLTRLEDLALLCSNCHRMVHRRQPWLRRNHLSRLLERQKN
jgi:hypothetical protein